MDFLSILQQLSEASVYAVLLVLGFVLFYKMHKDSVEELKKLSETSIKEIRAAYQDSNERFVKVMEAISK